MRGAITPITSAILIEPVQGESGITIATQEYLRGLRKLCDEHNLLLLFDEVQAGHFRTGNFKAGSAFLKAKMSILFRMQFRWRSRWAADFRWCVFWVREKFAERSFPGTHATTFGGTPLACAVALKIFEVIEREIWLQNARDTGDFLLRELQTVQQRFPKVVKVVRGLGL